MLAQLEIQEQEKPGRSALLLDDPAAELDPQNLARLMRVVQRVRAQLWVTSLRGDLSGLPDRSRVFHVEHGTVRAEN
jgi:recombinational DNA repair ATPase RecF